MKILYAIFAPVVGAAGSAWVCGAPRFDVLLIAFTAFMAGFTATAIMASGDDHR